MFRSCKHPMTIEAINTAATVVLRSLILVLVTSASSAPIEGIEYSVQVCSSVCGKSLSREGYWERNIPSMREGRHGRCLTVCCVNGRELWIEAVRRRGDRLSVIGHDTGVFTGG
jgi:hypothetical protein